MSFNTKKWLLFSVSFTITVCLFFLFQIFFSSRASYFRIDLKGSHKQVYNNVFFYSKSEDSIKIERDTREIFTGLHKTFYEEKILDIVNQLHSDETIFITSSEFEFLRTVLSFFQEENSLPRYTQQENCNAGTITFIGCIPFFKQLLEVRAIDTKTGEKHFTLTKKKNFQFSQEDFDIVVQSYTTKILEEYLKKNSVEYFAVHIGDIFLVQEKYVKNGWAVQYSKIPTDLYYIYNQMIYTGDNFRTPNTFVVQDIPFASENFPLLEFWNQYWTKTHPDSKPQFSTAVKHRPIAKKNFVEKDDEDEEDD